MYDEKSGWMRYKLFGKCGSVVPIGSKLDVLASPKAKLSGGLERYPDKSARMNVNSARVFEAYCYQFNEQRFIIWKATHPFLHLDIWTSNEISKTVKNKIYGFLYSGKIVIVPSLSQL